MSSSMLSLKNQFLIAMPQLSDAHFSQTVIYLVDHSPNGAMGFVINRPAKITLADLFEQYDIETYPGFSHPQSLIYNGGPLHNERGFILHTLDRAPWQNTVSITQTLGITSSRDILDALAMGIGPQHFFLALGCAGWNAGQLEQELANNSWLTVPANEEVLFILEPEIRWHAAAWHIGIDLNLMPQHAGHA